MSTLQIAGDCPEDATDFIQKGATITVTQKTFDGGTLTFKMKDVPDLWQTAEVLARHGQHPPFEHALKDVVTKACAQDQQAFGAVFHEEAPDDLCLSRR